MSTESHNKGHGPHHADVSFEPRDIQAGVIYKYLFALGIAVVVSLFICIPILRLTTSITASTDAPPPASRESHQRELPPEPRLQGVPGHQTDPQADLRKKIHNDTEANKQYGWIDRSTGIAQIPVKEAMKIIAEKGLPGTASAAAPAAASEKKL